MLQFSQQFCLSDRVVVDKVQHTSPLRPSLHDEL